MNLDKLKQEAGERLGNLNWVSKIERYETEPAVHQKEIEKFTDTLIDHIATTLTDEMVERLEEIKKPVRHFSSNDEGRSNEIDPVGNHKCNINCRPDYDEEGWNNALTQAQTIVRDSK